MKISARTLNEEVFESLGLASVSLWSEEPTGVFESEKAIEIGNGIIDFVNKNYERRANMDYKAEIKRLAQMPEEKLSGDDIYGVASFVKELGAKALEDGIWLTNEDHAAIRKILDNAVRREGGQRKYPSEFHNQETMNMTTDETGMGNDATGMSPQAGDNASF